MPGPPKTWWSARAAPAGTRRAWARTRSRRTRRRWADPRMRRARPLSWICGATVALAAAAAAGAEGPGAWMTQGAADLRSGSLGQAEQAFRKAEIGRASCRERV